IPNISGNLFYIFIDALFAKIIAYRGFRTVLLVDDGFVLHTDQSKAPHLIAWEFLSPKSQIGKRFLIWRNKWRHRLLFRLKALRKIKLVLYSDILTFSEARALWKECHQINFQ